MAASFNVFACLSSLSFWISISLFLLLLSLSFCVSPFFVFFLLCRDEALAEQRTRSASFLHQHQMFSRICRLHDQKLLLLHQQYEQQHSGANCRAYLDALQQANARAVRFSFHRDKDDKENKKVDTEGLDGSASQSIEIGEREKERDEMHVTKKRTLKKKKTNLGWLIDLFYAVSGIIPLSSCSYLHRHEFMIVDSWTCSHLSTNVSIFICRYVHLDMVSIYLRAHLSICYVCTCRSICVLSLYIYVYVSMYWSISIQIFQWISFYLSFSVRLFFCSISLFRSVCLFFIYLAVSLLSFFFSLSSFLFVTKSFSLERRALLTFFLSFPVPRLLFPRPFLPLTVTRRTPSFSFGCLYSGVEYLSFFFSFCCVEWNNL